jgi:hypothetical protein
MALSENGYPVLREPPKALLIPGTDIKLRVRGGDVATVLLEVASRFHVEVESLDMPVREEPGFDEWGWAYRPVRGQQFGFSNHASGTAIDLNATLHPRGVKGTFTRAERAKMRTILASTLDTVTRREVVRWGETYSGTVDGMHLELDASPAAVARVAARIRAKHAAPVKPKPAPVPPTDEGEADMKSTDVIHLGKHSSAVLGQADGEITYEESVAIRTAAAVHQDETMHAMAKTMAAMEKAQAAMLAELKRLTASGK